MKKKRISYLPYVRKNLRWLLAGPLFIAAGGVLEQLQPRFMANIVDRAIRGEGLAEAQRMSIIWQNGGVMLAVALLNVVCGLLGVYFISNGSFRFGADLRAAMYGRVQRYAYSNIDKFSSASLVTRLTNDVTNIQNTVTQTLRMATFTSAMLITGIVNAVQINARLALVTVFAVPAIAFVIALLVVKGFPLFRRMQEKLDALNARVQETAANIRVIKSFVREPYERQRFGDASEQLRESAVRASGLMVIIAPVMQLVMNGTTVAALWFGAGLVQAGEMEVGDLMAYNTYIMHILMSLMMLSMCIIMFSRAKACSDRIKQVLAEEPDIAEKPDAVTAPVTQGRIEFRHVGFRYDPASPDPVLQDIDLTVEPGEMLAIVGATGSSKSTLVNLIPRLYDVSEGAVLIDGVDVRDYQIRTLRQGIGMVPQKNVLFSGTVAENIRWGCAGASDEQMMQAASDAQADAFIRALPDGYDTVLSQGGVNVSGGQKQRLCIARALIKKPAILILDDSTSAVDTETEGRIRDSFRQHLKGTTVVLIAQRISSVYTADRILVLDNGRMAGLGTHEELLRTNAIYQEIVRSQQKGVQA
ncbi:MAG: ABC transporter ATP-binding protein [Clostridia bacterium]|nr:ABC transporter ATP-binding protein [Clostridia bacterium]